MVQLLSLCSMCKFPPKAFLVAATRLISGESFYTLEDINKLFCNNVRVFFFKSSSLTSSHKSVYYSSEQYKSKERNFFRNLPNYIFIQYFKLQMTHTSARYTHIWLSCLLTQSELIWKIR